MARPTIRGDLFPYRGGPSLAVLGRSLARSLGLSVSECRAVRLRASAWVTLGKAMERLPEEQQEGRGENDYFFFDRCPPLWTSTMSSRHPRFSRF